MSAEETVERLRNWLLMNAMVRGECYPEVPVPVNDFERGHIYAETQIRSILDGPR